MDSLLGQISKLSVAKQGRESPPPLSVHGGRQGPSFVIPAGRSRGQSFSKGEEGGGGALQHGGSPHTPPRASTPADDYGAGDDALASDEPGEVCKREDSETYAKRTITEIETCLGFRFGGGAAGGAAAAATAVAAGGGSPGGAGAAAEDGINDAEIQNLNCHIEAALAQGLSFKDKLRTSGRRRGPEEFLQGGDEGGSGGGGDEPSSSGSGDADDWQQHEAAALSAAAPPPAPTAAGRPAAAAAAQPGAAPPGGKKKLGGLKLAVGSQVDTGEWKSNGQFIKKEKAGTEIPSGLQQIKADDLVKVKELGRGCFGSVWLAKWRGVEVALKEMLHQGADTNPAEVFGEAEKLASMRHPCVMGFYGIVTSPDAYATVTEYICHGSLRGGLLKIKKKGINDKRLRAYIALQAAHGMEYLHLNYMVHFDLKCDNLLCDLRDLNKPVVKIGDLGLSKTKKGSFVSGNMRGTLPWMAPELFPSVPAAVSGVHQRADPEDRVTEKVDVFSFGVCMWEIWTLGEQPYPNLSLQEIFAGVMTGTLRPSLPQGCDPAWASLMQDCWQGNPRLRPSFTDVIQRLEAMLQRWNAAAAAAAAAGGGGGSGGAVAAGGGARGSP